MLLRAKLRRLVLSTEAVYDHVIDYLTGGIRWNCVQFVYLHRVDPPHEACFRQLLQELTAQYTFISYREAVKRILEGNIDAPYLAFSVDDGLACGITAASILKEEFNARACFFVCPGILDTEDRLQRDEFCVKRLHTRPAPLLTWRQVEELFNQGHEIGSHTMGHYDLAQLSSDQIHHEIGGSYEVLRRHIGNVDHFAWPYGRFVHFNQTARRAVFASAFASCASAVRGCHVERATANVDLCLRRDHIDLANPLREVLVFLARNRRGASIHDNAFPSWDDIDG
jgi:Polysaccharide deacetylase